jgi:hypothetical protein
MLCHAKVENGVQSRQVEKDITEFPEYEQICLRTESGKCSEVFSFATFMHTSPSSLESEELTLAEECVPVFPFLSR